MNRTVVIDCPVCDSKVRAEVLAKKEYPPSDICGSYEVVFVECPGCHGTMVGTIDMETVDFDSGDPLPPTRLWPKAEKLLDGSIPTMVQRSIAEASLCLHAKAYSACAVMCGKALEAICKAHGAKNWQLAKGLKELKDNHIIDGRLYKWGNSLRERRNIGAHPTEDEEISREDAIDVHDFTVAICEFIYVLAEKYEAFKKREAKRKPKQKSAQRGAAAGG